jgi:hypothetical protein
VWLKSELPFVFLLNEGRRRRNLRRWCTGNILKEGARYEDNLLADLKVEDEAGFRNFVRMTPTDFEVLQEMISRNISSFNVFSLVHILSTCLGSNSR